MVVTTAPDASAVERDAITAAAPPPGHPRFEYVDALRALAVIGVFAAHFWQVFANFGDPWWGSFANHARVGVTLFFVISGFLLFRPFLAGQLGLGRRPTVEAYAVKRVLRIVPAYWVALTAIWIYPGLAMGGDWPIYYLLAQAYVPGNELGGMQQAWSLSVEASFYVALPFLALGVARLGRGRGAVSILRMNAVLAAALFLGSFIFRIAWPDPLFPGGAQITLLGTGGWFGLGMLLAVASVAVQHGMAAQAAARVRRVPAIWWLAALGLLLAVSYGPLRRNDTFHDVQGLWAFEGLIAVLLTLPAIFPAERGAVRRVLANRGMRWLGLVSYGVFLWHYAVLEVLEGSWVDDTVTDLPGSRLVMMAVISFAVSGAIAAASWILLERRVLAWKPKVDARLGRKQPAPRPVAPDPVPETG